MEYTKNRKELAEKYFHGMKEYEEHNLGIITLISDFQHQYTSSNDQESRYWNTVLNNIKSILLQDSVQNNGYNLHLAHDELVALELTAHNYDRKGGINEKLNEDALKSAHEKLIQILTSKSENIVVDSSKNGE
jgi:hypothetical protein